MIILYYGDYDRSREKYIYLKQLPCNNNSNNNDNNCCYFFHYYYYYLPLYITVHH